MPGRGEVKRLHERYDKMQLVLMQETEQKIESDRKHEELIGKWKKQLEAKVRAFESLQKKFAPPRDLEQLRIKIQEELEGPYQQRIDNLQDEMERQRLMSFDMRREFETLKTEYEQFSIDQGNEMECVQETYELTLNDLRRKLQAAEDAAANSQHAEKARRLEQQREAAQIEIKALRNEVRDVREELQRVSEQSENEKSACELRLADEATRNATLDLDLKACGRQLTRAKDEYESIRSKWDHAQNKLLELTSESESLREQLKQKEVLIFSSHNSMSMKLRDERATWEREQMSLKVTAQEEALRRCQNEAEEATHKLQLESESLRKVVQTLEAEKAVMIAKQTSSHELYQEDVQLEKEEAQGKLKYMEQDYAVLVEKLDKEKENLATTARDLHRFMKTTSS
ncbi:uncharacterized protein PITG_02751 [Phytophthora infestans T30-4]|uniref:Uncharacterized protein n=1 Tax=Phytophthora infestans (strain T30-4) TaxID=403677 RepID=D0MX45_PHYIT|nr:uncharacterized protein PITG_02751 [Phytophthora infestans T30-4]EEY64208.1 conserved hypothetical protein [Phytophthora infestans T30-4]|eukprot:XP_002907644.1 conserved hypothetical protein [Phytophthora infestans T30-4]